jgi:xylose dehydrogenase (NAD/NADP)
LEDFYMKKLNWGILSTARINRHVLPAFAGSRRSQLAAVASRDLRKAQVFAAEWNISDVYGSYEALLADPNIDVIYNPLPNHMHAEWTIRAVQAGKHVLCEKPLALTVDEVDQIRAAAQAAGVVVSEAFMYRHHPMTLQVREWLASGLLGEIRYVRGSFTFMLDRPGDIRLQPEMGGGSLWDIGCYPASYAAMVMGAAPVEVTGWQRLGPTGVDLSFSGQLRYASGGLAQIFSSFELPYQTGMEIRGALGSIFVPVPFNPKTEQTQLTVKLGEQEKLHTFQARFLYHGEIEDMEAAVLDGRPQRLPLAESRSFIATLSALYQSAKNGRAVMVG